MWTVPALAVLPSGPTTSAVWLPRAVGLGIEQGAGAVEQGRAPDDIGADGGEAVGIAIGLRLGQQGIPAGALQVALGNGAVIGTVGDFAMAAGRRHRVRPRIRRAARPG